MIEHTDKRIIVDSIGSRYGLLTVVGDLGTRADGKLKRRKVECICDCGNKREAFLSYLKNGHTRSCGCLAVRKNAEKCINPSYDPKLRKHRLYGIWGSMKDRCYNEKMGCYKNYGGRGIKVCKEWVVDFYAFYSWCINNGYGKGKHLDRIDNDNGYSPENCKFSTPLENGRNKRNNINLTLNGETKCLSEWAVNLNITVSGLSRRMSKSKWSLEKALTTPNTQSLCKQN